MAVVTLLGTSGCKKRKKPATWERAWLGPSHACGLQKTGDLQCWGANESGQLGDRTSATHAVPDAVVNGGRPDDVVLGAHHTCLLAAGEIRCWGDGARGQLGTGVSASLSSPSLAVTSHGAPLAGALAIAAFGDQTCALGGPNAFGTEGGVRCWGLGRAEPFVVPGLEHATKPMAVGDGYVCSALSEPRAVRCVGLDARGQSAGESPILAGATVVGLTAGVRHACALLQDGSVQCWGANDVGQLGDGTNLDSHVPALVSELPPAVELRAGATHTCARLRTNTIACWGGNSAHQLADGTTKARSKPAPVPGLSGAQELAAAGDGTCARLGEGDVRCWGGNESGQLGDGTTQPHAVPMPVRSPGVVTGR